MVSPTSGKFSFFSCQHHYYCPHIFLVMKLVLFFFRCMLHNFAADFEMYGVLDALASGPIDARLSDNSTMVYNKLFLLLN